MYEKKHVSNVDHHRYTCFQWIKAQPSINWSSLFFLHYYQKKYMTQPVLLNSIIV